MERDWPEGRGIFHNQDKTFLTWVNEEDQLRIISMQNGGDVRAVFDRLARGIQARRFYKRRADVVFALYLPVVHAWSFFSDQWRLLC
jgi:hypothetical protein